MTHTRTGPGWTLYQAPYQETLARVAAEGGADLIAFSPPYCDARTYGAGVAWGDEEYRALGDAVLPALKPGGYALVNVDAPVRDWTGDGRGTGRGLHPWRMLIDWHDRLGFRVPDRLAFGRHGVPGDFWGFRNDWEPLLWFQRPGAEGYPPDHDAVKTRGPAVFYARGRGGKRPSGKSINDEPRSLAKGTVTEGRRRGTLWDYGAVGAAEGPEVADLYSQNHPARWPLKLAEDIVRCFCPVGGLVVDPFTGAGTTAAAAIAWDRRFIGGDLYTRTDDGKPWVDVAADVLIARQRQGRLFGGDR